VNIRRSPLLAIFSLMWIVILVSLYYVFHKPFSPESALNLARLGGQLVVAWGVISIGGGLGTLIYIGEEHHPLERLGVQAALGLGIISIGILAVGSILGVNAPTMWLLFLLTGAALWRHVVSWWSNWAGFAPVFQTASRLERAIAFGLGLVMLSTLFMALAPPIKFDALVYHLALPRAYLDAGRITYIPWLMYWGMPQISEMLYTWGMALAGVKAAVVMGWMIGLVAIVGIFRFISQRLNQHSAWIAIAALMAGFTTTSSLAWGYVGWVTILYGWAFLVVMDRWAKNPNHKELILAGVFAGLALGTKYTAGGLLLCGLGVVAWFGRKKTPRIIIGNLLLFGIVCTLVSSPWWIKNLIATGNPFYPFMLPAGAVDQLRLNFYQDQPIWGGWRETILLPIWATLLGREGAPGFNASIGPSLLALSAFAWVGWEKRSGNQRSALKVATFISVFGFAIWIIASRISGLLSQTRLYLYLFPSFALLAGAGFDGLDRLKIRQVRVGRVASVFVLIVLFMNVFQIGDAMLRKNAPQAVFSISTEEEYLLNNLGWYEWVLESIDELPEDSRVLMLWEPRSFYCIPKCTPDEVLDRWYRDVRNHQDSDDILQAWLDDSYTHLLYHKAGADFIKAEDFRYQDSDWQFLEILLKNLPTPLEFGDVYALYHLASP